MDVYQVEFRITATEAVKHLFDELYKKFINEGGSGNSPSKDFVEFMHADIEAQLATLATMKKELEDLEK